MRRTRAILVGMVVLAACGDSGGSSFDEDAVREAVRSFNPDATPEELASGVNAARGVCDADENEMGFTASIGLEEGGQERLDRFELLIEAGCPDRLDDWRDVVADLG